MAIMTKRGNLDNIVTYEHICDTYEDLQNIDPKYATLGSTAIVINQEEGLNAYMATSAGEWAPIAAASGGGSDSGGGGITPTGTYNITANGTYNVTRYATAKVNVPNEGIIPSGNRDIYQNGIYDVYNYSGVNVQIPLDTLSVEENGNYQASNNGGYSAINVNVNNLTNYTVYPSAGTQRLTSISFRKSSGGTTYPLNYSRKFYIHSEHRLGQVTYNFSGLDFPNGSKSYLLMDFYIEINDANGVHSLRYYPNNQYLKLSQGKKSSFDVSISPGNCVLSSIIKAQLNDDTISITLTPSSNIGSYYEVLEGYIVVHPYFLGYSTLTIAAPELSQKTVTPTTETQIVTPSLDNDITASKILNSTTYINTNTNYTLLNNITLTYGLPYHLSGVFGVTNNLNANNGQLVDKDFVVFSTDLLQDQILETFVAAAITFELKLHRIENNIYSIILSSTVKDSTITSYHFSETSRVSIYTTGTYTLLHEYHGGINNNNNNSVVINLDNGSRPDQQHILVAEITTPNYATTYNKTTDFVESYDSISPGTARYFNQLQNDGKASQEIIINFSDDATLEHPITATINNLTDNNYVDFYLYAYSPNQKVGLSQVTVNPIPSNYVPKTNFTIYSSGLTGHDFYATANSESNLSYYSTTNTPTSYWITGNELTLFISYTFDFTNDSTGVTLKSYDAQNGIAILTITDGAIIGVQTQQK